MADKMHLKPNQRLYKPKRSRESRLAGKGSPDSALREELRREHELLTTIVDNVDMLIVSCDAKGRFTLVNRAARELPGFPVKGRAERGRVSFRFLSPQTHEPIPAKNLPLNRVLHKGEPVDEELLMVGPDGQLHYVLAHARPLKSPDGRPSGAVLVSYDHTDLVEAERQLADAEQRRRDLIDALPVLAAYIDRDGRFQYVNRAYERLWRQPREAIVGKTVRELFGEKLYAKAADAIRRALAGEVVTYEDEFPMPDQPRYLQVTLIPDRNAAREVVGLHTMLQDISDSKRLELELRRTANHDPLTDLPNRRYMIEWLGMAIAAAKRREPSLYVLFIDLDGFKAVNDNYGHEVGDAVLTAVGDSLRECLRASDFIARFGGDEFVAILTNSPSEQEIDVLMERLLQRLGGKLVPEVPAGAIGASVGIAAFPRDGDTPESLIQAADRAMYRAKSCGKGCFCIRHPEKPESDPDAWHIGYLKELKAA